MKTLKYIISGFCLLSGFGGLISSSYLSGLIFIVLGIIIFPITSELLKEKLKFWNYKGIRYISYIVLFLTSGAFMKTPDIETQTNDNFDIKKDNFKKSDLKLNSEKEIVFNGNGEKIGEKTYDPEEKYKKQIEQQFLNDNSEFWTKYDPIVKKRIYEQIKEKDCQGLQNEFNTTADNLDRIQNSGGSGSRNLELMDFLDDKMKELGCYK